MEQMDLFEDLPPDKKYKLAQNHVVFMYKHAEHSIELTCNEARSLFGALGNFLKTVEANKNGC